MIILFTFCSKGQRVVTEDVPGLCKINVWWNGKYGIDVKENIATHKVSLLKKRQQFIKIWCVSRNSPIYIYKEGEKITLHSKKIFITIYFVFMF